MKRSVLAVVMAGVLVLASPNPAWAFNREFRQFKITQINAEFMRVVIAIALLPEQNPPHDCLKNVPVDLQRRRDGRFRTIRTFNTDNEGRVRIRMRLKRGLFRARAREHTTQAGNQCFEEISSTMRF